MGEDIIINTDGFYKFDENNQEFIYAPNAVYAPTYTLLKENHEQYEYPIDGWYWFNSQEEALAFNNQESI